MILGLQVAASPPVEKLVAMYAATHVVIMEGAYAQNSAFGRLADRADSVLLDNLPFSNLRISAGDCSSRYPRG